VTKRLYTTKQMGDAGEMLVAAELTLNGIPAFVLPDNWPGYDVIAEDPDRGPQRISVKTRTFAPSGNFVGFGNDDKFDWLAIVILSGSGCATRRIFIVTNKIAKERSYPADNRNGRGFFVHKLTDMPPSPLPKAVQKGGWGLADYENNFVLKS
jgi:hypothetical protein